MDQDNITQAKFIEYLETLVRLIEAKADTKQDAVCRTYCTQPNGRDKQDKIK